MFKTRKIILIFTLLFSLDLRPTHASETEGSFWSNIIDALAEGIGPVNIESASLGVDSGLINNIIVGTGRTVERNPHSNSKEDRFLVKDRMRLGYELGAGFVVSGSVSYIQEWTVVYPAETLIEGQLSQNFLIDLLLPKTIYQMERSQEDQEYTIIREAFIEGNGRLSVGKLPMLSLGAQASVGRVKLFSTLAKRFKDNTYKVMMEKSYYNKLATELWLNLIALKVPIFDSLYSVGDSKRTFYEIDYKNWSELAKKKLFQAVISGSLKKGSSQTVEEYLLPYKIDKNWESEFKETKTDFSLFLLYNKSTYNRVDYINETIGLNSQQWWQWEDRRDFNWTNGLRGESFKTNILFSGKRDGNKVIDPILSINISIDDQETTEGELQKYYTPLTEGLIQGEVEESKSEYRTRIDSSLCTTCFPNVASLLNIKLFYTKKQMEEIIFTSQSQWQNKISETTGKSWSYWKRAQEEKFHSRSRRRMRQTRIPLKDISFASNIHSFLEELNKARSAYVTGDEILAYRHLSWAVRSSFYISNIRGHNTILLKSINSILKENTYSSPESIIKHRLFSNNEILSEVELESSPKIKERMNQAHFPYILEDPAEIYYFF